MRETSLPPSNGLRRIGRESLRDQVCGEIRAAVLNGTFAPGERVTIRALAAALGTSPTPVREALNQFVADGTFDLLPNGSVAVPEMTAVRFQELVEIRQSLEGLAAMRAAERAQPSDCDSVTALLDALRTLAAKSAWRDYLVRHREFHFRVYGAARMPMLSETIDRLWMRCGPVLTFVVPDYVARKRGTAYHADLVAALVAGDGDGAAQAMRTDIGEAGAYLLSLADRDGVIRPPRDARRSA